MPAAVRDASFFYNNKQFVLISECDISGDDIPGCKSMLFKMSIFTIASLCFHMVIIKPLTATSPKEVLPYISYTGMCSPKGYGFEPFWSENGLDLYHLVSK